jgi:hypothetical protein
MGAADSELSYRRAGSGSTFGPVTLSRPHFPAKRFLQPASYVICVISLRQLNLTYDAGIIGRAYTFSSTGTETNRPETSINESHSWWREADIAAIPSSGYAVAKGPTTREPSPGLAQNPS